MAVTSYGVNAPEAVKLWSRKLAHEAFKETYIGKFIGDTSDSLIQKKTETQKGPGDRITCILRVLLSGDGIQGDSTLEGNEEALTTYTDNLLINQLRHATRSAGKMSEQRVPFSMREEGMMALKDWWAERYDTWFFNQICGNTAQTDTRYTGNNAAVAPDSSHIIRASTATTDQAIVTSTAKFTLSLIDKAVEKAKTISPMIRPIRVNGAPHYVMFLHPYQVTAMRTNVSTGQWMDIQKAAMNGGNVSKNPIFTGALGVYNNVILHEAFRITQGVHSTSGAAVSNTRRAVLCGAQAAMIGFGQGHGFSKMDWTEELHDYGNQLGIEAGCIGGLKKTVYNSQDFGTIAVTTFAKAA